MRIVVTRGLLALFFCCAGNALPASAADTPTNIQLGPRPFFLVTDMADGPLKACLQSCSNGPFRKTDHREGDVLQVLDVLAREVGVMGVFSDWPATVSYYASCMGLK